MTPAARARQRPAVALSWLVLAWPALSGLALSGLALGGCDRAATPTAETEPTGPRIALTIEGPSGRHAFRVWVAQTPEQQARGLMYRNDLPDDGGMLFPLRPPRVASFWMKDTPLPLDLLFIRLDGSIARIATNVVPFSEEMVTSGDEAVGAVLELEGGKADALGIAVGDRVTWDGPA